MAEGKADSKETFLPGLVRSWVSRQKETRPTETRKAWEGRAGIETAALEMLQTQTGKSPVPSPETQLGRKEPSPPPLSRLMLPHGHL